HAVGVTGAGVNVAVLDSGIDTDHPELANDLVEERCWCRGGVGMTGCCPNGFNTQIGPGSAEDDSGHGTNVIGVITSALGVAPNSGIVALRVLDSSGEGNFSDIDAALDWLLDNHVSLAVRG
ncbi:MAG: S8 family serine peptidase, partial [Deltaproteobacteria bacterium]|nr:S8 family serine peptidase [Deltaproteobacteria bacterium]